MPDLVKRPSTTRASDADRDRVLKVLSDATSDGRLSVEEHHELMTQTLHAKTIGELEVITTDLAPHADPDPDVHVVAHPASRLGLLAIFAARTRKGGWQVPTEFRATAIFGAIELDFRDAQFDAPEVLCVANCVFGAIEITVPDWVRVIDEGTAIFGAREESGTSTATPTVTLRLKGMSTFGAVEVKHRAPKLKRRKGPELEEPAGP
ncbi:MAG TPA: DUF1707 domain-containing protein [Acidimicrobiales bacterium]|nr:DUF1707 domain-containing protein [Acidimicrobiales bacterium]